MTKRQLKLHRAILDFLADQAGPVVDTIIHAAVNESFAAFVPLTEVNEALEISDRNGWIISVQSQFKGCKRALSDEGRVARLEMR